MKTAAIYLFGIPSIDKPQALKTVKYEQEIELKDHLKKLQDGFCEGEKPKIENFLTRENKKAIMVTSSADFYHIAYLGMRIKPEANKPIEVLTFPAS